MKFLLTIYEDESRWATMGEQTQQAELDEYWKLDDDTQAAGVFVASQALASTPQTKTVQVRGAEGVVSDGPFAETKEQLGGFYLLECDEIGEAIEWAKKVPAARTGHVEVRPVIEFERPARNGAGPLAVESA